MRGPIEAVARAVEREWDRTRYSRDRKKDNSSPRMRQRGARALLPILTQCCEYHRRLVEAAGEARPPLRW